MTTLLALDPGMMTGWSLWHYDAITPPRPLGHGEISGGVMGFIPWWRREIGLIDEVVSESFRLGATEARGNTNGTNVEPLRIEGALASLWDGPITYQSNQFKAQVPDEVIKRLGLWWPGEGHATDSLRHAWAYLKLRKHTPTTLAAWPDRARTLIPLNQALRPDLDPVAASGLPTF